MKETLFSYFTVFSFHRWTNAGPFLGPATSEPREGGQRERLERPKNCLESLFVFC